MSDTNVKAATLSRRVSTPSLIIKNARQAETVAGWLMAAPALILIGLFLIVPFLMAFVMSFTNQRLISPNPTEFVGTRNFTDLLNVRTLTLEPVLDEATGAPARDSEGNLTYLALRDYTRNNPDYPELNGLRELLSWTAGDSRVVLLASDVVFIRALVNTLYFVVVIAPAQGFLALLLAMLINQPLRGINISAPSTSCQLWFQW